MINFGVFSPSSRLNDSSLEDAMARCEGHKLRFNIHPQTHLHYHQSAGLATDKVKALNDLMRDNEIDAIWTSIGGNRAATILDFLDNLDLKSYRKPLIGFSDATTLLNALYALTGTINIHGPGLQSLNNPRISDDHITALINMVEACINKSEHDVTFDTPSLISKAQSIDHAQGTIIGGNLSVFQSLIGTPFLPQNKPFILFLEDIGDHLSRYDRMLRHLGQSGIYDQCSAILLGDFGIANDNGRTPFGFTLDEILDEHFGALDIPVYKNLSFGHRGAFTPLPVGAKTLMELDQQQNWLHLSFDSK